jgi:LCP family protein required for cell wall assembly
LVLDHVIAGGWSDRFPRRIRPLASRLLWLLLVAAVGNTILMLHPISVVSADRIVTRLTADVPGASVGGAALVRSGTRAVTAPAASEAARRTAQGDGQTRGEANRPVAPRIEAEEATGDDEVMGRGGDWATSADAPAARRSATGPGTNDPGSVRTVATSGGESAAAVAGRRRGYGLVAQDQPGTPAGAEVNREGALDRPLTLLVMGVDARPGEPIDVGVRPDALGLLRLDPTTGSCRLLAIPRDTRAELPGYGRSKINHALVVGGVPYQRQVVEGFFGIEIDRFVLVDFVAVEGVVEAVGGVTLDVPEAFTAADGLRFEAGPQRLDGPQALAYARYRSDADGDLGRIERQQQVLRALLAEAPSVAIVPTVNKLGPLLEKHLKTDLSLAEILGLVQRFRSSCTAETLVTATLDGATATFDDPLVQQPLSYLLVDEAEIRRKKALLLADPVRP